MCAYTVALPLPKAGLINDVFHNASCAYSQLPAVIFEVHENEREERKQRPQTPFEY